ncbi:uncharacterized protein K460DRAFT_191295 [Cucurbitaria berberidis CBS 394.84]|uniref:Uncharacterized protein n=1 Tax=Cucurbitaria berberidis CBS 394.84 TaxID=1168544 RepID=A0A9P4G8K8_9PLEO|nr:uncharacterized protein K460DRAFT_191295 [Cucurbitaria berberidis CBS 394.84]KAF1840715.1 hypothetical protein K460DRAFT_191295 [Cucurbitaria berberidis CBS 394.84]
MLGSSRRGRGQGASVRRARWWCVCGLTSGTSVSRLLGRLVRRASSGHVGGALKRSVGQWVLSTRRVLGTAGSRHTKADDAGESLVQANNDGGRLRRRLEGRRRRAQGRPRARVDNIDRRVCEGCKRRWRGRVTVKREFFFSLEVVAPTARSGNFITHTTCAPEEEERAAECLIQDVQACRLASMLSALAVALLLVAMAQYHLLRRASGMP